MQSDEIKKYCNYKDWEIQQEYMDKVSGAKDSRPALDNLMKDARKGKFKHIVFWKIDRLGRNAIHIQTIAEEWKKLGISFTITTMDIDTSKPSGMFIFGIFAQFAQMERALTVERTKTKILQIKKSIDEKGYYKTKDGKKITSLGRPKGKKDSRPRRKSGYYQRWVNK